MTTYSSIKVTLSLMLDNRLVLTPIGQTTVNFMLSFPNLLISASTASCKPTTANLDALQVVRYRRLLNCQQ